MSEDSLTGTSEAELESTVLITMKIKSVHIVYLKKIDCSEIWYVFSLRLYE